MRPAAPFTRLADYPPHRAFVGQPQRYDLAGGSQFALLFLLGLREHHRLLDFGCGSLRLGRLVIPYLQSGHYFGVEPEAGLVEAGLDHELGRDALFLKQPRFLYTDDYRVDGFGTRFDFIIAQSVFSHAGSGPTRRALAAFADALEPGGLVVANWLLGPEDGGPSPETTDWVYPDCVAFMPDRLEALADEAGLKIRACPWPHPELHWFVLARDAADLPTRDVMNSLRVAPPAWRA